MPRFYKFSFRSHALAVATVALAFGLAALPFSGSVTQLEVGLQSAHAKPGGNGKGKGGAGRGGEKAGSSEKFAKKDGKGAGRPAGRALVFGKPRGGGQAGGRGVGPATDGVSGVEPTDVPGNGARKKTDSGGISASALGSLNAAHASPTARANASPRSRVGQIAAYEGAIAADDLQAAAESLASAANKEIDADVVAAVNGLLGLEVDPAIEAEVADKAEEIRAGDDGLDEESDDEAF